MSRLESFIRRLVAQRDCLDAAGHLVERVPGVVLEFGLGNGRTFDHLRTLLPDREIFVFDRRVGAHPDCVPDEDHMIVGDVRVTLTEAGDELAGEVAPVHADLGSGRPDIDHELSRTIAPLLVDLVCPGGVIVSDQSLPLDDWQEVDLPPDVPAGRYYMYRAPE